MKSILRSMELVMGHVPCTDAARRYMRNELYALQVWLGLPTLFITLNPADTRHPFVVFFSAQGQSSAPWLPVSTDNDLAQVLASVDVAHRVALDPVAVALAFHHHVQLFLVELLGCSKQGELHLDGVASAHGTGALGPIAGYYGVTEPQLRGSLHVHMLVHLYACSTPAAFARHFIDGVDRFRTRLVSWMESLVSTAVEAVPRSLGMPEAISLLHHLQPLPFSTAQQQLLSTELGNTWDFPLAASHWRYGGSRLEAASPWADPCQDLDSACPTFSPWPRTFLTSDAPPDQWTSMLLYDLRHAALHCCLHECKPRTCHKGWLGRHGFCRLGFWHWKDVSQWTTEDTWQRCHGLPLCPEACIGEVPPLEGVLLPERHHPYHTRFHVGALAVAKCNHDINVLLKAPLEAEHADRDLFCKLLASSARIATYYITAYISKVQPHLASLWHLLEAGQRRLEADLALQPQPLSPQYVASRTLTRMQMSAQKRAHKSLPEICHYLLGFPEAYVSHSFRRLYYTSLVRRAALILPLDSFTTDAPETVAFIRRNFPSDEDEAEPDNLSYATQDLDYLHRGPSLASWPLYFYVAGVRRCSAHRLPGDARVAPFASDHLAASSCVQRVCLSEPWSVPVLAGPRIPPATSDSELRALILLILFKPWCAPDLSDLLVPIGTEGAVAFSSWSSAFQNFSANLASCAVQSDTRPLPFSDEYWAHRALAASLLSLFLFLLFFSYILLHARPLGSIAPCARNTRHLEPYWKFGREGGGHQYPIPSYESWLASLHSYCFRFRSPSTTFRTCRGRWCQWCSFDVCFWGRGDRAWRAWSSISTLLWCILGAVVPPLFLSTKFCCVPAGSHLCGWLRNGAWSSFEHRGTTCSQRWRWCAIILHERALSAATFASTACPCMEAWLLGKTWACRSARRPRTCFQQECSWHGAFVDTAGDVWCWPFFQPLPSIVPHHFCNWSGCALTAVMHLLFFSVSCSYLGHVFSLLSISGPSSCTPPLRTSTAAATFDPSTGWPGNG